ncbi:hypothetical protein KR093_007165 [Drosophila rubida]|uniref:Homeobox domain-containing protein n=1 Tax=Drosophila rubida TaxID=30044 RepID=A0AAD4PP74_9MUSC|nr:hypothetical protein KR093_007165 [Drosophila rubida]
MLLQESANMEQSVPENLSTHVFNDCELKLQANSRDPVDSENGSNSTSDLLTKDSVPNCSATSENPLTSNSSNQQTTTKVKLSFSVDRLLSSERADPLTPLTTPTTRQCCDGGLYACCTFSSCFPQTPESVKHSPATIPHAFAYADNFYQGLYMDYKSVLRPTPIRAAEHASPFPTLATNALLRFHHQQQQQQLHQQQSQHLHPQQQHPHKAATLLHSSTSTLNSLKTLQLTQQQRFLAKAAQQQQQLVDIPTTTTGVASTIQNGGHAHNGSNSNASNSSSNHSNNANGNSNSNTSNNNGKRKRSWSRAVFTNLQRKGLEIQFQQQKYITKPDRRKLAARLNLTDAQVKVWFQNRRMKWRHTRENLKSGHEKQPPSQLGSGPSAVKSMLLPAGAVAVRPHETLEYSSDSCSSVELSDKADDDDNIEIDVVE